MVEVLTGIHVGTQATVSSEGCTIGSSYECDVVLADKNIAPDHLTLRAYGKLIAIDAVGGEVAIDGHPTLAQGYGCRVNLPVTLGIGDTQLTIARPGNDKTGKRWPSYLAFGLAGVAIVVMLFQTGLSALMPGQALAHGEQRPAAAHQTGEVTDTAVLPAPIPSSGDVAGALQTRIEDAGLDSLAMSADGSRLVVAGQVPADQMQDWHGIQHWFDSTYGANYVLSSQVGAALPAETPQFSFQAVWFGENPYIIDAQGERRFVGAALQDGWLLKSIEPDGITVSRGAQEFRLTI